ncbi:hypothetical protein M666_10550 [Cellulophaga baltica 18]|uniref:Peptidase C39 domain-containing protein n=1 Tax=Cellulophaga baltica 18 TaxID=1348584 RepID=A0AAU8RHP4_9FLAO|nr:hypothetical protein M666_10550 [Cellulophaga baltica 18]
MYWLRYLFFLFSSTNQHGVHSPFVYTLVTKGLYKKDKYTSIKSLNTALKLIDYFKISEINLKDQNETFKALITEKFPNIGLDNNSESFIYLDNLSDKNVLFLKELERFNNDTLIYINNINKNYAHWQALITLEKIKVSIDTFHGGILFFRREQVKEHFKIRI